MTRATAGRLKKLLGKRVVFQGKFEWGVQDQLRAMAKAQQATIGRDLNKSTVYLVINDLSGGKTIQKQAVALNAKGASIQVIGADDFQKLVEPTDDELLALIRAGSKSAELYNKITRERHYRPASQGAPRTVVGENFDGLDLRKFNFDSTGFNHCSFVKCNIGDAKFVSAEHCDFTNARAPGTNIENAESGKFNNAMLEGAHFCSYIAHADFSGANLAKGRFHWYGAPMSKARAPAGAIFRGATLKSAQFANFQLNAPDFESADLSDATFIECDCNSANFRKARLRGANLFANKFAKADFSGADLRDANLVEADLTDARFDGADLSGANLGRAKLDGADLSRAKGYQDHAASAGTVGPALKELDVLAKKAKRIRISFHIGAGGKSQDNKFGIDTSYLKYGWGGVQVPYSFSRAPGQLKSTTFSDAMLLLASLMPNQPVRFDSLEVQSTKSPKGGKELRDLVLQGISEGFAQPLPDEEKLAATTKAHRERLREKTAALREKRDKEKAEVQKREAKEKAQINKKVAKAVGKVTDIATFLKALELRADVEKIKKATKMLKAEKFKLFNDITDSHMSGVVKSQTDPDLVYACHLKSDGTYACCTQNLNICGGLRGSICKHLLVLIIGLTQAGELDPASIDGWIAKTHKAKPALDKEVMGEIFIKYKGAEAGEVDWRPTETVPEDYYAL